MVDFGSCRPKAARNMARPAEDDFEKLKRIGRYLVGRPRLVSKFAWHKMIGPITAYSDSVWAGCEKTRRSTSGGVIVA